MSLKIYDHITKRVGRTVLCCVCDSDSFIFFIRTVFFFYRFGNFNHVAFLIVLRLCLLCHFGLFFLHCHDFFFYFVLKCGNAEQKKSKIETMVLEKKRKSLRTTTKSVNFMRTSSMKRNI